jgi:hypothetical protein
MKTFTDNHAHTDVIGTKPANELSPGDKVYFPGTGLVKRVHSTDHHKNGFTVYHDIESGHALEYPKAGVLVRWSAPHNRVNWYVAPGTVVEITA